VQLSGGHSVDRGGRLFCNSLATLILAIEQQKLGIFQVQEIETKDATSESEE